MSDVSSCNALQLVARSTVSYGGYRVSFGDRLGPPLMLPRRRGYQASFELPAGDMTTVTIPFNQFTLWWDGATGEALKTCDENPEYCPDAASLRNMKMITIGGQGVPGPVHLEVESISAVGCSEAAAAAALHEREEWKARKIMANAHATPHAPESIESSSPSSRGSTSTLVACAGVLAILLAFALVRRRRSATKQYQGLDRFLVDCPEKFISAPTCDWAPL